MERSGRPSSSQRANPRRPNGETDRRSLYGFRNGESGRRSENRYGEDHYGEDHYGENHYGDGRRSENHYGDGRYGEDWYGKEGSASWPQAGTKPEAGAAERTHSEESAAADGTDASGQGREGESSSEPPGQTALPGERPRSVFGEQTSSGV